MLGAAWQREGAFMGASHHGLSVGSLADRETKRQCAAMGRFPMVPTEGL